jgi:hypothetical protein
MLLPSQILVTQHGVLPEETPASASAVDAPGDLRRAVLEVLAAHEAAQHRPAGPLADLLERLTELLQVLEPAVTRQAVSGPPAAPHPPRGERADRDAVVEAVRDASKVQGCPALAVMAYTFAVIFAWNTVAHTIVAGVLGDRHPEHKYVALGTGIASGLLFWCGRRLCRRRRQQVRQATRMALRRLSRAQRASQPPVLAPARPLVPLGALVGHSSSPVQTTEPVAQPSPAPAGPASSEQVEDILAARDWLVEAICAVAPRQGFPLVTLPLVLPAVLLGIAAFVTALVAVGSGVIAVGWVSFGLGLGCGALSPLAYLLVRWRRGRLTRALDQVALRHDTVLKRHPEALRTVPTPFNRADPLVSAWHLVRFLEERSGRRRTVRFCCPGNSRWFAPSHFYDLYLDGEYCGRRSVRTGFDERLATTPGKHQLLIRYAFGVGPTPQHALGRTPVTLDFTIGLDPIREVEFRHERSPGAPTIVRMS